MTERIVIGLGANLGDRRLRLAQAVARMRTFADAKSGRVQTSPLYETPALLPPRAPAEWDLPFLNQALLLELPAPVPTEELLKELKAIERALGRKPRERWAPREIDLDILAWNEREIRTEALEIPHPGLLERAFAINPLADLWPDWIHPRVKRPARELRMVATTFPRLPKLVGILNVTPDSFSDGNRFLDPTHAQAQANALAAAGANVIDIGAESTRPQARAVSPEEEWARLAPVLPSLQGLTLSLDTRHPETARKALDFGIAWLNDVEGLSNPRMIEVAAAAPHAKLVVMHSLCVPVDPAETIAPDQDPVDALAEWMTSKAETLARAGIARERIIFDPGIGFGKTADQSLSLIRRASELKRLGFPLLYGHSRKSFLARLTGAPAPERDFETWVVSQQLAQAGVDYLRVHDVATHARGFRVLRELAR